LHLFREVEGEMLLDDVSDSSLSGLRVDSDDGFVSEGAICGVEGKVGDLKNGNRFSFELYESARTRQVLTSKGPSACF